MELTDSFKKNVAKFSDDLKLCKDFDEIKRLWSETNIPYSIDKSADPLSTDYMDSQMSLYKYLSGKEYLESNELTSLRQDPSEFEIGFPWVTRNFGVISDQFFKTAQALKALDSFCTKKKLSIVEYGSGWGNLALPLAKAGCDVYCVDIDKGFLDRLQKKSEIENLSLNSVNATFMDASKQLPVKFFDFVIFQSSFHHCLNFSGLLSDIKNNVLNPEGEILFFAEPIFEDYPFPWGIRFDGESLWAVIENSWLELGFDMDFFSKMCLDRGFFLSKVDHVHPYVGYGFRASQVHNLICFNDWLMPKVFRNTWHFDSKKNGYVFSKSESHLPGLCTESINSTYEITVLNFAPHDLPIKIVSDIEYRFVLPAGQSKVVSVSACVDTIRFFTNSYIPDIILGNGDTRDLGFAVGNIKIIL